jgi:hypothetical protein
MPDPDRAVVTTLTLRWPARKPLLGVAGAAVVAAVAAASAGFDRLALVLLVVVPVSLAAVLLPSPVSVFPWGVLVARRAYPRRTVRGVVIQRSWAGPRLWLELQGCSCVFVAVGDRTLSILCEAIGAWPSPIAQKHVARHPLRGEAPR